MIKSISFPSHCYSQIEFLGGLPFLDGLFTPDSVSLTSFEAYNPASTFVGTLTAQDYLAFRMFSNKITQFNVLAFKAADWKGIQVCVKHLERLISKNHYRQKYRSCCQYWNPHEAGSSWSAPRRILEENELAFLAVHCLWHHGELPQGIWMQWYKYRSAILWIQLVREIRLGSHHNTDTEGKAGPDSMHLLKCNLFSFEAVRRSQKEDCCMDRWFSLRIKSAENNKKQFLLHTSVVSFTESN